MSPGAFIMMFSQSCDATFKPVFALLADPLIGFIWSVRKV